MDFASFFVTDVIIHEVPAVVRAHHGDSGPTLSEVSSPLNNDQKLYFRERVITSLAAASYPAIHDPDGTSPVPEQLLRVMRDAPTEFVPASQLIAQHLYDVQHGGTSNGLLALISGEFEDSKCIVILKLEEEKGVQVRPREVGGKKTLEVHLLDGLTLTEGTKVFKAALFPYADELESLSATVSDNQRPYLSSSQVADFFLRFLGCQLALSPEIQTRDYYEIGERFINSLDDPEKQARYAIALLSEMNSNVTRIRPRQFAEQHFDTEDQDTFLNLLRTETGHVGEFAKQTSLLRNRISRLTMDFDSGLRLLVPPDAVDLVTIGEDDFGPMATIRDSLTDVLKK